MFFLVHRQMNPFQQQAYIGFAGNEQFTGFTAFQHRSLNRSQTQLPFQFVGIVATDALLFKNGVNNIRIHNAFVERNGSRFCMAADRLEQEVIAVG